MNMKLSLTHNRRKTFFRVLWWAHFRASRLARFQTRFFQKLPSSASSQMITFYFENGAVLTMRTSGTEPKIKYYSEMIGT